MDWLKVNIKEKIVTIQFGQLQGLRTLADWDPEDPEGADLPARGAGPGRQRPQGAGAEGAGAEFGAVDSKLVTSKRPSSRGRPFSFGLLQGLLGRKSLVARALIT